MTEFDVFSVAGVDDLFAADVVEFVAGRDALVKQLKKDGEKEAAAAVKALRKPSAVAGAVNRVARQQSDDIAALLAAGQAVRAAQVKAVQGQDDGGLRTAARDWRALIQTLAGAVAKIAGAQYRDDAAATFEAASADEALGVVLQAGRLTAAFEPTGFGLAGMPDPPERRDREVFDVAPEPAPAPAPELAVPDTGIRYEAPPVADEPVVDDGARKRLDEREAALEKATHRLRRAEQRLDQAKEAVDEAAAARDDALAARDEAAAEI